MSWTYSWNCNLDKATQRAEITRCCFQAWFDHAGHESGSNCTCYQTCYVCDHTSYGYKEVVGKSSYNACSCNFACYLQELECSCNAVVNMPVQDKCGCDNACDGYQGCSPDACNGYQSCICDGTQDRFACAQCDLTQYDLNSPGYYCPCDITCDKYTIASTCNCDGAYQKTNPTRCHVYTMQERCSVYADNVDWNYVTRRYY